MSDDAPRVDFAVRPRTEPARRSRARAGFALVAWCTTSFLVAGAVHAAFVAQDANAGSALSAGSVAIDADSAGTTLLTLPSGALGASTTACTTLTSSGTLPSEVRHYAATAGTLPAYLDARVVKGSGLSTPGSCTGFVADTADHRGLGAGVVYDGPLSGLGTDWATGVVDPQSGTSETWTQGEAHGYRITVTIRNDAAANGRSGTVAWRWEARSTGA